LTAALDSAPEQLPSEVTSQKKLPQKKRLPQRKLLRRLLLKKHPLTTQRSRYTPNCLTMLSHKLLPRKVQTKLLRLPQLQRTDQGQQAPAADPGAAPAAPSEPESMKDIIDRVKKDIRQQVIDELSKELTGDKPDFAEKPQPKSSTNDNLVTAFIDLYKPRTGYSSAKLASIFGLLWQVENRGDVVKMASSPSDLVDLFQFIDRFEIKGSGLKDAHYNLLRTASMADFSSLKQFIAYLNRNQVTDKAVIKSMVTKASFIRDYHRRKVTN
jgi:hypothetical protein